MFPLGTVLVPGMALPLHVFEPRYRRLVEDCLAGSGEFGVVLIERGSEVGGGDVRTSVGTVVRIVEAAVFPDGRYALGCVGTRRIRVADWLDDDPYPRAEVEDWPDPASPPPANRLEVVAARLRRVLALHSELGDPTPAAATWQPGDDPELASYQAVALCPFGPADRQALLAAPGVAERLDLLEALLVDDEDLLAARLAVEGEVGPAADGGFDDGPPSGR